MKKFDINQGKLKTICITTFLAGIIFSSSALATDSDILTDFDINYTNSYMEWMDLEDEEKEVTKIPKTYSAELPDSILEEYTIEEQAPSILRDLILGNSVGNKLEEVSASVSDSYFNLSNYMNITVKNQQSTNLCWAFAMLSSLETNIALTSGSTELPDFSERHMGYATSRTFIDGINESGFDIEVNSGGLPVMALAYLTNGQGAVLEEDMPFEDNENQISLSEIEKQVDTTVTGYATLPTLSKEFNSDGTVKYSNGVGTYYTDEEVEAIRNVIKSHIINYGAVASLTAGNQRQFYNNSSDITKATAYFCNDTTISRDHAITIVGWDDNYSKDNFNEANRPSRDGAYIALSSYGSDVFDNGYIYISYEDFFIESEIYVITSTEKLDYDEIYQHDSFGGIFSIGTTTTDTGYYANVYERDASKDELLTNVGITVSDYVNVEVYVNPNGNITSLESLTKIGESNEILEPGYHRLDVTETKLTGTCFAIVIKQTSENGTFYFSIEANVANTAYDLVDSNEGQSLISFDGNTWSSLSNVSISSLDMTKSDVCIKSFTTVDSSGKEDENLSVGKYKIDGEYIMKIANETTINKFLEQITTSFETILLTINSEIVTDYTTIVKTGMILKLSNDVEYKLIVRGDLDCNGKINITDLSKLIMNYHEVKDFVLTDVQLKAADLNYDGNITLTDISQFIILYNTI